MIITHERLAEQWGVTVHNVKSALLAEDYAISPDANRVERVAVMLYRAEQPITRLPEAANDGPEIAIIQTVKQAFDELEAENILNIETEFCRKVGVL
jgi:hypothetical protein